MHNRNTIQTCAKDLLHIYIYIPVFMQQRSSRGIARAPLIPSQESNCKMKMIPLRCQKQEYNHAFQILTVPLNRNTRPHQERNSSGVRQKTILIALLVTAIPTAVAVHTPEFFTKLYISNSHRTTFIYNHIHIAMYINTLFDSGVDSNFQNERHLTRLDYNPPEKPKQQQHGD